MKAQTSLLDEIIVDNFAGGGGASTGMELALSHPVDIAVNHDPDAVAMHKANHPYTKHYCESVWDIDPVAACEGRPVGLAWFSPDCKHFSKAKGGKPRSKRIRGLAWVVLRWAAKVKPRVIMLENVEEFQTWGPLRKGKPDKRRSGETFRQWKGQLEALGYKVEMRELRACDYGAPTIRKRFFVVARRDGMPIVWPEPTHGDPKSEAVKAGKLLPWRTAAEIIDWSLPCPSIFDTSEEILQKYGLRSQRPLAEATLRRIARGIQKFVVDNPQPFIVSIGQTGFSVDRSRSIDTPLNTTVSKAEQCIVAPTLVQYHGEKSPSEIRGQGLEGPLMTVDGSNRYAMAAATLIQAGYGEAPGQAPRVPGLDKPIGTVVAKEKHALVTAFLAKHYGGGYTGAGNSIDEPVHTVTGVDHNSLVTANLVKFQQNSTGQLPEEPLHTCTTATRFGVVESHLVKMKGDNIGQPAEAPLQTIMAGGTNYGVITSNMVILRNNTVGQPVDAPLNTITASPAHFAEVRAFLIKYYGTASGQAIGAPLHTTTAQDRFGLVTIQGTEYAIVDIGLRMLSPRELFNANGAPADYIIDRDDTGKAYPKHKQVARCGNMVPPQFSEALVRANLPELCGRKITTMAELDAQVAM